jgi:hypothetical protein
MKHNVVAARYTLVWIASPCTNPGLLCALWPLHLSRKVDFCHLFSPRRVLGQRVDSIPTAKIRHTPTARFNDNLDGVSPGIVGVLSRVGVAIFFA